MVKVLHEVASLCALPLLSLLAQADLLGRITPDQKALLLQVSLFDLACQDAKCWISPYAFLSDEQRFHYFYHDNAHCDYVPWNAFKSTVVILSALPGMEKDYFIAQHYHDWPVVSLDAIRRQHKIKPTDMIANGWVVQQANEQAKSYLRKGISFVWNATNITRQLRQQLITMFVNYNAYVHLIYLETSYQCWIK